MGNTVDSRMAKQDFLPTVNLSSPQTPWNTKQN